MQTTVCVSLIGPANGPGKETQRNRTGGKKEKKVYYAPFFNVS